MAGSSRQCVSTIRIVRVQAPAGHIAGHKFKIHEISQEWFDEAKDWRLSSVSSRLGLHSDKPGMSILISKRRSNMTLLADSSRSWTYIIRMSENLTSTFPFTSPRATVLLAWCDKENLDIEIISGMDSNLSENTFTLRWMQLLLSRTTYKQLTIDLTPISQHDKAIECYWEEYWTAQIARGWEFFASVGNCFTTPPVLDEVQYRVIRGNDSAKKCVGCGMEGF